METLRISETTERLLKDIAGEDKPSINTVYNEKQGGAKPTTKQEWHCEQKRQACKYCGGKHERIRTKCPAYGTICWRCKRANHFHTVCLKGRHSRTVAAVEEEEHFSTDSEELIYNLEHVGTVKHNEKGQYFVQLCFEHKGVTQDMDCQLDTGATCNVMCLKDVCAIQHTATPQLQPSNTRLKCYDNSVINTLGQCTLQCFYQNSSYQLTFKVITGNQQPLLSGTACTELGLITMNCIHTVTTGSTELITQYNDVFTGLGCLEDEYHIT